jgi:hypothetical protein
VGTPSINHASVVLSVNRGLWGEVSSCVRSVQVEYNDAEIHIFFYFDGQILDDDKESASVVGTSVAADFPSRCVFEHCLQYDTPQRIVVPEGRVVVFLRKESGSS